MLRALRARLGVDSPAIAASGQARLTASRARLVAILEQDQQDKEEDEKKMMRRIGSGQARRMARLDAILYSLAAKQDEEKDEKKVRRKIRLYASTEE